MALLPFGAAPTPTFTSTKKGSAPASGGGTTNFLRADGTWAAPAGSTSPVVLSVSFTAGASPIANNVLAYDTVEIDTASGYNISTGLYTAGTTGSYVVGLTGQSNTTGSLYVQVNGASVGYVVTLLPGPISSGSKIVSVTAGQTIGIYTDTTTVLGAAGGQGPQNSMYIALIK